MPCPPACPLTEVGTLAALAHQQPFSPRFQFDKCIGACSFAPSEDTAGSQKRQLSGFGRVQLHLGTDWIWLNYIDFYNIELYRVMPCNTIKIPISDEKANRRRQVVLEFQSVSGVSGKKSRCKTGAREAGLFTRCSFVPRFLLAASQVQISRFTLSVCFPCWPQENMYASEPPQLDKEEMTLSKCGSPVLVGLLDHWRMSHNVRTGKCMF